LFFHAQAINRISTDEHSKLHTCQFDYAFILLSVIKVKLCHKFT